VYLLCLLSSVLVGPVGECALAARASRSKLSARPPIRPHAPSRKAGRSWILDKRNTIAYVPTDTRNTDLGRPFAPTLVVSSVSSARFSNRLLALASGVRYSSRRRQAKRRARQDHARRRRKGGRPPSGVPWVRVPSGARTSSLVTPKSSTALNHAHNVLLCSLSVAQPLEMGGCVSTAPKCRTGCGVDSAENCFGYCQCERTSLLWMRRCRR
jgi:hypothetical protein